MNALCCVVATLEVKTQKRKSDDAALRLTNNVLALFAVWVHVRVVRGRYVTGPCDVHSAASCVNRKTSETQSLPANRRLTVL